MVKNHLMASNETGQITSRGTWRNGHAGFGSKDPCSHGRSTDSYESSSPPRCPCPQLEHKKKTMKKLAIKRERIKITEEITYSNEDRNDALSAGPRRDDRP